MQKMIVVGAVAGGATCASQIRRLDNDCKITIFERDRDMSFANCGLPYYLGQIVSSRDQVLPITPSSFKEDKNIDVKTYHEVVAVDTQRNIVTVRDRQKNQTFEAAYDKLILSPGANANKLNSDSPMVFTLRNMEDTDQIDKYIKKHHAQRALIVGAGYIALEILENLYHRGLDVTLIHRSEQINKLMDSDMNQPILEMLNKHKIPYRFNEEIDDIDGSIVHFKSGHSEQYDIVIEGVGTHPNSKFLESSNIQLDTQGFIPVNDKFETNISNVYALGDVIKSHYRHVNLPAQVPLAWGAHRAASIIAEQIAGNSNITFKGYLGSNIVKFFDYSFASVGIKPNELKYFDYKMVEITGGTHAGYYPGNDKLHLRAYFDTNNRKIIRASAVGKQGVDKRIDVLSMAMMNDLTIDALTEFEVAYAPPYSHPKDLINMLGYKARNL